VKSNALSISNLT